MNSIRNNIGIGNAIKHIFILVFVIAYGSFMKAQEAVASLEQFPDTSLFEAHRHIKGNDTLPYRLYRSEKSGTVTEALPLVIFLHGAGERGNDNCMQLKHCIKYFLDDTVTSRYPFLLMAPQCPNGKRWVNADWSLPEHTMDSVPTTELRGVMAVLDSLIDVGTVDSTQV